MLNTCFLSFQVSSQKQPRAKFERVNCDTGVSRISWACLGIVEMHLRDFLKTLLNILCMHLMQWNCSRTGFHPYPVIELWGMTWAVSTRHVSEPFAIDRERFAACCPCPHGRNHLSTRNERARTGRDRSRLVDFVVWTLERALDSCCSPVFEAK